MAMYVFILDSALTRNLSLRALPFRTACPAQLIVSRVPFVQLSSTGFLRQDIVNIFEWASGVGHIEVSLFLPVTVIWTAAIWTLSKEQCCPKQGLDSAVWKLNFEKAKGN